MQEPIYLHPHRVIALQALDALKQVLSIVIGPLDVESAGQEVLATIATFEAHVVSTTRDEPLSEDERGRINNAFRTVLHSFDEMRDLVEQHLAGDPEWEDMKFNEDFQRFIDGPWDPDEDMVLTWPEYVNRRRGGA